MSPRKQTISVAALSSAVALVVGILGGAHHSLGTANQRVYVKSAGAWAGIL